MIMMVPIKINSNTQRNAQGIAL